MTVPSPLGVLTLLPRVISLLDLSLIGRFLNTLAIVVITLCHERRDGRHLTFAQAGARVGRSRAGKQSTCMRHMLGASDGRC
jgi:hypothetical protein